MHSIPRTPITVGTSPVITNIPTDYASRWHILFKNANASPGNLTVVRYRRYAIPGGNYGPWETYTLTTPLAPGASAALREFEDCSASVDLELTCGAAACTIELEVGAPPSQNG